MKQNVICKMKELEHEYFDILKEIFHNFFKSQIFLNHHLMNEQ